MKLLRSGRAIGLASLIIVSIGAAGCGPDSNDDVPARLLDVYAASSLTSTFSRLEADFEAANPGVDVRLNLAGSSDLARQINAGAEADVFVTADVSIIDQLDVDAGGDVVVFATNVITVALPSDNPAGVDTLADLSRPGVLTARCSTGVPCGTATDAVLDAAGVDLAGRTDETSVRSVLAKVVAGEVDAGFVYLTDAIEDDTVAAGVTVLDDPALDAAVAAAGSVTLGAVELGENDTAGRFVRFLVEDSAQAVLTGDGFGPAP